MFSAKHGLFRTSVAAPALACALVLAAAPATFAQQVVIAQSTDATSMDPAFRGDTATGNIQRHIFDTVLQRGADMEIGPALAESVERETETQWLVKLRPDISFSNGEPVDAQALKFSIERAASDELAAPTQGWWKGFTSTEIVDAQTLRITTSGPDPLFRARMTLLAPVPPKYLGDVGEEEFARKPIGSGPYVLDEWRQGEAVTLSRNPDYWGEPPAIETVVFRVVPEELSRISALRTGEADVVAALSPTQAAALEAEDDIRVGRTPGTRVMVIQFDDTLPPGDNLKFRQAVSKAINRDAIIKGLLKGYGVPVNSILSPGIPEWPKGTDYTHSYDLEGAKALFAELQLPGDAIVLRSPSARYPNDRETALAVGQQLQEAGLNVEVRPEEWGRFFDDLKNGEVSPLYLMGQGNVWLDPYPQVQAFHASDGFLSTWDDEQLDSLLAESNQVSVDERAQVFDKTLRHVADTVAAVPLYAQEVLYGISSDITWQPRPDEQILATEMTVAE